VRRTELDRKWDDLMTLCAREAEFSRDPRHPKLMKLVAAEIETLARELGFPEAQIQRREFRAVKNGDHIVRLLRDS
jgi:hypothetical protein